MQGVRLKLSFPVTFYLILSLIGGLQLTFVIVTAILLQVLEVPGGILQSP
jgi:hypothetical protein